MSETEEIPKGYAVNTSEQKAKLQDAVRSVFTKLVDTGIGAVACVFVMPDGTVTAALAGAGDNISALASLMATGPEVLRLTVERMKAGKGETKVEGVEKPASTNGDKDRFDWLADAWEERLERLRWLMINQTAAPDIRDCIDQLMARSDRSQSHGLPYQRDLLRKAAEQALKPVDDEFARYFRSLGYEVDWDYDRRGAKWYEILYDGQMICQVDFGVPLEHFLQDLPLLAAGQPGTSSSDYVVRCQLEHMRALFDRIVHFKEAHSGQPPQR